MLYEYQNPPNVQTDVLVGIWDLGSGSPLGSRLGAWKAGPDWAARQYHPLHRVLSQAHLFSQNLQCASVSGLCLSFPLFPDQSSPPWQWWLPLSTGLSSGRIISFWAGLPHCQ